MRGAFFLGTCLLLSASPLTGQRKDGMLTQDDMRRVRPNSCPIADSLAGRPLARPTQPALGWRRGRVNNLISNDPFALSARKPIDAIMLTAISEGPGPHPDATYAMQLRLKDSVLREGAAAALILIIDDSITTEVGDMLGETTPWARNNSVDQMLTQALPASLVRKMVAGTSVRGRIGPTDFIVPPRTLETFRSVFIAASCGERL